jgi:lycopene cyclase CruA
MREILYLEIPTPDTATVLGWLQNKFQPGTGKKVLTPSGFRLITSDPTPAGSANFPEKLASELSIFVWSVQRTTYLKAFRWADRPFSDEGQILKRLTIGIRNRFPHEYPEPPAIDLSSSTIFEALAPYYPPNIFRKCPTANLI